MDPRIERIRTKVVSRNVSLGPILPQEDVASYEKQHGIELPSAYRDFLIHVGNGGAGPPEYGVLPLGHVPSDMRPDETESWRSLPDVLKVFPFIRAWVWEDGEPSTEGTDAQVKFGSICVGNDGCGMYWHLIVNGPERGNLWMLCGEGIQPTSPKRDFLNWYEDWLDGVTEWWK